MAQGYTIGQIAAGMSAEIVHQVTEADIEGFARITGDNNPVHLDEAFAAKTQFGGRIAHGMLTASLISAVLGTRLPGPGCIYLGQSLTFRAPVKLGAEVTTRVTVKEVIADKRRVKLDTVCLVDGKPVLDGEALVMVPKDG
ncbi:MAG TPA: MaoC family dehydratase [Alphaproteobacteria bacterium]